MIPHLFKFSLRALRKQGGYVLINVLGLAIGIVCTLLISLFIIHELSYDQYHEDKDRIYQMGLDGIFSGQEMRGPFSAAPIGPAVHNEFPEVESFLRINAWDETIVQVEDRFFTEHDFLEADSTFFEFFSIPLLSGHAGSALTEPHTVVLSQTTARRMFGDEDPLGKMIRIGGSDSHYRVTGVMADIPETTHFRAGMIGSFTTNPMSEQNSWLSSNLFTYLKLYPQADPQAVSDRFDDLILKYVGPQVRQYMGINIDEFYSQGNRYNYYIQPLTSLHLSSLGDDGLKPSGDPRYLWIFGGAGLLILLIASINFMNLSTAQATKRAREVGVKKVLGSSRNQLVGQFVAETVCLSLLALLVAVIVTEFTIPYFNNLLSLDLSPGYLSNWYMIPLLVVMAVIIGLFAGIYPAFYLSSFNPVTVLKGKAGNSRQSIFLRQGLTVIQFAISLMLITGSFVMYRQLDFMLEKDLGFEQEHVLVIRRAEVLGRQVTSFKSEVEGIPGIISVSASTAVPGRNNNNSGYMIRGRQDDSFLFHTNWVDYDYLETYGITLEEGRFFDPDMSTDSQACIINQSAVRKYQLDDPFSERISSYADTAAILPVIGIASDYHFESLQDDIAPCILRFKNENLNRGYVSIRMKPGATKDVLEKTGQLWASFAADDPMLYFFMDEDFRRFCREEQQNAWLSVLFTIVAIVIASMGLYGLTAFSLQQRIREIGIRKTFGATVTDIWYMFCKDVMLLIGFATLVGWPLIYWILTNWLQNYHYRIDLQVTDFLVGFFLAVIIALATISYRVLRTASMNPSEALRDE
ncbi:MAG: FtsX-like permease family protein [Bacteroidales bacterium]